MKKFRTRTEQEIGPAVAGIFEACPDSTEEKIQNFPKYVRRQHLKRFLAMYEIFKLVMNVKGSVIDCGVFKGFSLMSWAKISAMLEPENLTRRVYGFDTFSGFVNPMEKDENRVQEHSPQHFASDSKAELESLIEEYDRDRFLGHIDKVHLVAGDAVETIPRFVEENGHLLVSLLFLDFDLFEPTKVALEHFMPRMPKGAVIAFDELDNPMWPGETLALIESLDLNALSLQRLEWDPYISYAVIE